jgi:glycine cleavage system H protein
MQSERRFSQKHEWVSKDGSEGTIGISNYAQDSLGDVVYVQLPDVGTELAANGQFISFVVFQSD